MHRLTHSEIAYIANALRLAAAQDADTETDSASLNDQFQRQAILGRKLADVFDAYPEVTINGTEVTR